VPVDKQYEFEPQYRFLVKKRDLSKKQMKAIRKAGKSGIFILKGGAGTGKTLTACLIAIEYSLVKRKVIMTAVTDTGSKQLGLRCSEELECY
jgi:Rad3-related DNA helicase